MKYLTDTETECDITLFVACYNEEKGIIPTLQTLLAALDEAGCSYDIVVIDDASKDRSVRLVEEFTAEHPEEPITLVRNEFNQGLGVNYVEAAFLGADAITAPSAATTWKARRRWSAFSGGWARPISC